MDENYTTCKLIFPVDTPESQVKDLLTKYTTDFSIANFYSKREIGCNTIAFAIVDIPYKVITKLFLDEDIKGVEIITSFNGPPKTKECCESV